MGCVESFGDLVESAIARAFFVVGLKVGRYPRWTIVLCFLLTVVMGTGFMFWETENRDTKLWVPQNTMAEDETESYKEHFPSTSRFNQIIIRAKTNNNDNVLTKEVLMDAIAMHTQIETQEIEVDGVTMTLKDVCTKAGGSCVSKFDGACSCLINSILKQWNYNISTLETDGDFMSTLSGYGTREDMEAALGKPQFGSNGTLISAEAFTLSYFLDARSEVINGNDVDEIGETWEEEAFLKTVRSAPKEFPAISVDYFATRSFGDEFGDAMYVRKAVASTYSHEFSHDAFRGPAALAIYS
jgi:Patched family